MYILYTLARALTYTHTNTLMNTYNVWQRNVHSLTCLSHPLCAYAYKLIP